MPNTLAHLAVQGLATRAVLRGADLKWIFLGCVIPDAPWILQRTLKWLAHDSLSLYDLRLYAIVQGSLIGCLLLCGAAAALSAAPKKVFYILALNSLFHLLLDACQTKWANGVHLFAPLSWRLLNFEIFWPESLLTVLLTLGGVVYVVNSMRRPGSPVGLSVSGPRSVSFLVLLAAYYLLPILLISGPEAADNHSVRTLRNAQARPGAFVEFDRNAYSRGRNGDYLETFAGEELAVRGLTHDRSGSVSVRGRFVDENTVEILALHAHWRWFRNAASYAGLVIVATVWMMTVARYAKERPRP